MEACLRKRMVTPDEIEKILTNKELGDEFSDANTDDKGGNNHQKQGLSLGGKKTIGSNETIVSQRNELNLMFYSTFTCPKLTQHKIGGLSKNSLQGVICRKIDLPLKGLNLYFSRKHKANTNKQFYSPLNLFGYMSLPTII
ncbi:hypothetical protein TNCV_2910061 [Trichonephila clavipes]|nr:hypothetical protein TNCV_2910061 [Trichonephila clavipes]